MGGAGRGRDDTGRARAETIATMRLAEAYEFLYRAIAAPAAVPLPRRLARHRCRGSVVVFSNNIFHRGGLAQGSRSRDVMIFHLYPAVGPFDVGARAMRKTAGVPSRPDF